jgi:putative ABC transport system ATP-binding protein
MSDIALEVKDLVKSFAVDHVSFQVKSGEFVALVGPSGSGKTTMLSILAALLAPTSGQVLIDGQDLAQMNEKRRVKLRREKIGFTFQSNNLIPFLTAQENVEFMLRLNGQANKAGRMRSAEILARLGLSDRLHNLPAQLSGGQQQRVAIARALIHTPPWCWQTNRPPRSTPSALSRWWRPSPGWYTRTTAPVSW